MKQSYESLDYKLDPWWNQAFYIVYTSVCRCQSNNILWPPRMSLSPILELPSVERLHPDHLNMLNNVHNEQIVHTPKNELVPHVNQTDRLIHYYVVYSHAGHIFIFIILI
eukprot:UN18137